MKRYRLAYQHYLRMEGMAPNSDPVLLEEGAEVGEGTAFPFQGPPTPGMIPLTDEARDAHKEYMETLGVSQPTLKDTQGPSEGGAAPFDPASSQRDSTVEKAASAEAEKLRKENEELKQRLAAMEKATKDAEAAKASPDRAAGPTGATGATGAGAAKK